MFETRIQSIILHLEVGNKTEQCDICSCLGFCITRGTYGLQRRQRWLAVSVARARQSTETKTIASRRLCRFFVFGGPACKRLWSSPLACAWRRIGIPSSPELAAPPPRNPAERRHLLLEHPILSLHSCKAPLPSTPPW